MRLEGNPGDDPVQPPVSDMVNCSGLLLLYQKKKKEVINVRDCIIFRALLAFLNIFAYSCFVFDLNLFAVHINKFAIVL